MTETKRNKMAARQVSQLIAEMKTTVAGRRPFGVELSTEQMYGLLSAAYDCETMERGRAPIDDAATREHLEMVARALTTADSHFGLMLNGVPGSGKTTMALAVRRALNALARQRMIDDPHMMMATAREIVKLSAGEMSIGMVSTLDHLKDYPSLIVDDLGDEPAESKVYGKVTNPTTELMLHRYNRRLYTIVTTNLTPKALREKYGERIADRFKEMFVLVSFTNSSYR